MTRPVEPKQVIVYVDADGNEPFSDWLTDLKDAVTRRRIIKRIARVEAGNYGDYKSLTGGLFELRFTFGPGHRVYFGEDSDVIVVLLCGGDKSTQDKDIELAREYWKEYQNNE